MGKADHRKTRELDKAKLAELAGRTSDARTATPQVTLGRAKTLDDPLTTGLLAEVARNAQTAEFDAAAMRALVNAAAAEEDDDDTAVIVDRPPIVEAPIAHPNTRRRQG